METFRRYWPFVRGIHRSPVNSPHKGQWRGVLMFSLICAWIHGWVNKREAAISRRHRAHNDVIVMRVHYIWSIPKNTTLFFQFCEPFCWRYTYVMLQLRYKHYQYRLFKRLVWTTIPKTLDVTKIKIFQRNKLTCGATIFMYTDKSQCLNLKVSLLIFTFASYVWTFYSNL